METADINTNDIIVHREIIEKEDEVFDEEFEDVEDFTSQMKVKLV